MSADRPTAGEFLQRLKATEASPFTRPAPSQQFSDIHAQELAKYGLREVDPEKWFDDHFKGLLHRVADTLPEATRSDLLDSVAVGCVDSRQVNACIIRGERGPCYAILVNRALLTMLNHHIKLIAAANYPSSVLHFDGYPTGALPAAVYTKVSTAILQRYGATGKPVGPELKLALDSPAMELVEEALIALHAFVLGHEVGHYINGDLDSEANFAESNDIPFGPVFGTNVSHTMEFAADRFAFETVLRMLRMRDVNMPARRVLDLSVTLFFNFLREISNRGSESHPKPSDRILSVTREFFGGEAAHLMEASFNDLSAIAAFRDHVGSTTVSELLDARA